MRPGIAVGALIVLAVATTAVADVSNAARKRVPRIEGRSMIWVGRPDPGFLYVTNGNALAGAAAALGPLHDMGPALQTKSEGKVYAEQQGMRDPAVQLGAAFVADLADAYELKPVASTATIVADDKGLDALRRQNPADLIFELYTQEWRTFYFLDFKHYDVWYFAKARLIDARSGDVLRRAKCAHRPVKTADSPTLEELMANDGARLRSAFDAAGQLCLATLREEFGIEVTR